VPPWLSAGGRPGPPSPAGPVDGSKPLKFTFKPSMGYVRATWGPSPTPGRRSCCGWFGPLEAPFFKAAPVVAAPAEIAAGQEWPWHRLADLEDQVLARKLRRLAHRGQCNGCDDVADFGR
jgi:hypothetical protein